MRATSRILLLSIAIGAFGCATTREEKEEHIDSLYKSANANQAAAYDMEMRGDHDPARREAWANSAESLYDKAKKEEAELDKEESCASQIIGAIFTGLFEGIINAIFHIDDDDDCDHEDLSEYPPTH